MHLLEDVLHQRVLGAVGVERQRAVALGVGADVLDVRLRAGPPHAEQLLAREAGGDRLLERGRVHHAPAPQQRVVGTIAANLQPGRLLLHAGRGHRQQLQLEAMHLGALLERGDRLLAEGRVVVDQRNLLALELVQAAFLLAQVLDQDVGRGPVAAHQREVPLEHAAVLRGRQAVAERDQRDLVDRRLVGEREGDAGGLRVEHGGALALQALVALHALVGGVAGLAFFKGDLDAVDAAVGVDVLEIVLLAVGPGHAVGRIGTGAVGQQRNELLLGQGRRGETGRTKGDEGGGERERLEFH